VHRIDFGTYAKLLQGIFDWLSFTPSGRFLRSFISFLPPLLAMQYSSASHNGGGGGYGGGGHGGFRHGGCGSGGGGRGGNNGGQRGGFGHGGCIKWTIFPFWDEGEPTWTGSLSSPDFGCGCLLSRRLMFPRAGGWRAQLPPPSDLLVFSTTPESVGVPLSPVASVASCGSAVAGHSGGAGRSSACFPSESRHPGASSTPPGLTAHKHALRDEGRAKAATGGVFPFVPRKELTIEVKPNLLNVLD
jgi:hypothetical protein